MKDLDVKKELEKVKLQNSELKKQNKTLQLSQTKTERDAELLNMFCDFSNLGYMILECDTKIVRINDSAAKTIGLTDLELINTTFHQFILVKHQATFNGFLERAVLTKRRSNCKIELVKNDNTQIVVELFGLYLEKEMQYAIAVKNISKKVKFINKRKEDAFFFNETERLGIIGSYKVNFLTDTWEVSEELKNIFGIKKRGENKF